MDRQVISEQGTEGYSIKYAVGAYTLRRSVEVVPRGEHIAYISNDDYMVIKENAARISYEGFIRQLRYFVEQNNEELQSRDIWVSEWNRYSWDKWNENQVQLIQLLYGIWDSQGDAEWFKDAIIDLIYRLPDEVVQGLEDRVLFAQKIGLKPKDAVR